MLLHRAPEELSGCVSTTEGSQAAVTHSDTRLDAVQEPVLLYPALCALTEPCTGSCSIVQGLTVLQKKSGQGIQSVD